MEPQRSVSMNSNNQQVLENNVQTAENLFANKNNAKRSDIRIVHELEKFTLVEEEVKLERRGKSLDRYFFRNFYLYCKEVWFSFVYAVQMFVKTYTNFKMFVPNVRRKWVTFKRFWAENWKPLVFISRLGEFWSDFTRWVRTPRRANGTGRRRFFSFYIFGSILAIVFIILVCVTPEGEINNFGEYVTINFFEHNATVIAISTTICAVAFIQSAFGFNNIYKRFLNTTKRYPLVMGIIIGLLAIALFFGAQTPFVNLWNLDASAESYDLMKGIAILVWGLVVIACYVIVFFDGYSNIIARIFFSKGVDGSNTLSRNVKGWLYLLPALIPLFVFTFLPMINALLMGFVRLDHDFPYTSWTFFGFWEKLLTNENDFVKNHMTLEFFKITFEDPAFYHSLITTTIIAIVTVPICTAISVFIAVFLNSIKKLQAFFQTVYFLPYVTSMTAVTAVWRLILQDNGPLNTIFGADIGWLGASDPLVTIGSSTFLGYVNGTKFNLYSNWAYQMYPQMFGYIIYSVWNGLAFKIVIFLSGLQSIDKQIYQAAELDGASAYRKFVKITVPLLAPILLFNTLTSLIGAFKAYTATKTLFLDSPRFQTIVYYMFQFINNTSYDRGSAVAFILFFILLLFTLVRMMISKRTNIRMSKEDKRIAKERAKTMKKRSRAERILGGGVQ